MVLRAVIIVAGCLSTAVSMDLKLQLADLPGAAAVESNAPQSVSRTIIHILDWHHVPKDRFAADLRDVAGQELSDDDIDVEYTAFLEEVEAVQAEQIKILRALISRFNLQHIYVEGLTEQAAPAFRKRIEELRKFSSRKPRGISPIERLLLAEFRDDLLQVGATGRLMVEGEINVLPAEESNAFQLADPLRTGEFRIDAQLNARREREIVKNLLKDRADVTVIILGGAHDLTDHVPADCQYVRVRPKKHPGVSKSVGVQRES